MPGVQKSPCSYYIKPAVHDSRADCKSIRGGGMGLPMTHGLPWFRQFFPLIPSLHLRFSLRMLPNYAITIPHKLKTRLHFLSPREWQVTGNTVSQCIQESFTFHQVPCLGQKGDRCHKHNNTHKLPNFKLVEYCLYKKIVASATPPSSVL